MGTIGSSSSICFFWHLGKSNETYGCGVLTVDQNSARWMNRQINGQMDGWTDELAHHLMYDKSCKKASNWKMIKQTLVKIEKY